MGSAYSEDLRLKVLRALDQGMSKMVVHKTFGISRSTIDDWLKLREQTGHVKANTTYRRGRQPVLLDTPQVHAFFHRHRHSTLDEMAKAWEQEHGQALSLMTFSTTLRRLGYTRKKRAIFIESDENPNVNASLTNSP